MSSQGFAEYLIELRRRRRLLQKQVAATAGLDPSYVASLERGRRAPPRPELLNRLLLALNASTAEKDKLVATAAADRLSYAIARHRNSIDGADVLARIASCLPSIEPEDLITLERVAVGFTSRGDETRHSRRDPPTKEKTA